MSENNHPQKLASAPENNGAHGRLGVRVCTSCAMDNPELAALVRELQTRYAEGIDFEFEDCLDLCDFSPSTIVAETIIAPASPQRLREEIERAQSNLSD